MNKLVDSEKLLEIVNKEAAVMAKQLPYRDHAPYVLAALRLKAILNEMDDALIRCKDCDHMEICGTVSKYSWCMLHDEETDMNDFCSGAER